MKSIYFLFLIFSFRVLIAQESEQVALNFYAKEFKDDNKGKRIRYDGKITQLENRYANSTVLGFYDCKSNVEHYKKIETDAFDVWEKVYEDLESTHLEFEAFEGNLTVPKGLVYRKNLRDSSVYRKFVDYYLHKVWYWVFPEKYNVIVYPAVKYKDFSFVEIHIDKKDGEYGRIFYVKLNENSEVLDSCESAWIQ